MSDRRVTVPAELEWIVEELVEAWEQNYFGRIEVVMTGRSQEPYCERHETVRRKDRKQQQQD